MDIELELLVTEEEVRQPRGAGAKKRHKPRRKDGTNNVPGSKNRGKRMSLSEADRDMKRVNARKSRTKRKVKHALAGKAKSTKHKKAISAGLKKYWASKKSAHRRKKARKAGTKRKTTSKVKRTRSAAARTGKRTGKRKPRKSKSPSSAVKAAVKTGKLPSLKNGAQVGSPALRSKIKKEAAKLKKR